jgi:hypothetical protein
MDLTSVCKSMFLFGVGGRMLNIFHSNIWGPDITQNDKDHFCESAAVREFCILWPIKYEDEFSHLVATCIQYCSKDAKEALKKFKAYCNKMNSSENKSVVLSGLVDLINLTKKPKSSRHVIIFYHELISIQAAAGSRSKIKRI